MISGRGRRAALVAAAAMVVASGCAQDSTSPEDPGQSFGAETSADHGDHAGHEGHEAHEGHQAPTPPPGADWNQADAHYLTMMIPHHRQAIEMSLLADDRAVDPQVRRLAEGIGAGQGAEILEMAGWLDSRGLPEPTLPDAEAMAASGDMAGMLGPEQMAALADAEGAAFDRLFLRSMIAHHEGAVAMADDVLGAGIETRVTEMASDVVMTQAGEIDRMEQLLAAMG